MVQRIPLFLELEMSEQVQVVLKNLDHISLKKSDKIAWKHQLKRSSVKKSDQADRT